MTKTAGGGITPRRRREIAGVRARASRPLSSRPLRKKGYVDHTQYDTGSILRFITRRFGLPELPGLRERDQALVGHGEKPMGDLTGALKLGSP